MKGESVDQVVRGLGRAVVSALRHCALGEVLQRPGDHGEQLLDGVVPTAATPAEPTFLDGEQRLSPTEHCWRLPREHVERANEDRLRAASSHSGCVRYTVAVNADNADVLEALFGDLHIAVQGPPLQQGPWSTDGVQLILWHGDILQANVLHDIVVHFVRQEELDVADGVERRMVRLG